MLPLLMKFWSITTSILIIIPSMIETIVFSSAPFFIIVPMLLLLSFPAAISDFGTIVFSAPSTIIVPMLLRSFPAGISDFVRLVPLP